MMIGAPRSSSRCLPLATSLLRRLSSDASRSQRSPAKRPMKYEMWSPANAPAAAKTMIPTSSGWPLAANTPALITSVSLGTMGKNASIIAKAKSATYTHGEPTALSRISVKRSVISLQGRTAGRRGEGGRPGAAAVRRAEPRPCDVLRIQWTARPDSWEGRPMRLRTALGGALAILLLTPGLAAADVVATNTFALAPLVGVDGKFHGDNGAATRETDEPHNVTDDDFSVWVRWQAPATGAYTVDLCGGGTAFDTTLGVYHGDDLRSLPFQRSRRSSDNFAFCEDA